MKSTRVLVLVVGLLGSSGHAHADPAPAAQTGDPDVDEARRRFQRGVELYREGSFDAALAEFNKAYQLAPNYRVLYNLAEVQAERHDYVAALRLFEKYLKQGGADVPADRREQVEQELRNHKGKVAEIGVSADVEGAELLVDGVSAGELPLKKPLLVNSGVRQLQLRKIGYAPNTRTLTIAGGETQHVEFHLQGETTLPPDRGSVGQPSLPDRMAPALPEQARGNNAPLWVSLAATGLFAGGAVTFGLFTHQADKDLDTELNRFPPDSKGIDDARSKLKRDAALTDGFAVATAIAGGCSIYFALSGPSSPKPRAGAARASLRLVPAGRGIHVLGEF
jgi:tetratricopeptide (TPR) repeat protein